MRTKSKGFVLFLATAVLVSFTPQASIYQARSGKVNFKSEAPLEIIKASSQKLVGLINTENNNFAFSIPITSFVGFNSELQREHFNENYMESAKYAKAKFVGSIKEKVAFNTDGNYEVTADGKLTVHGVTKERTISATLTVRDGIIHTESSFNIPLEDHDIAIPKIVDRKIAEVISVEVAADFKRKD